MLCIISAIYGNGSLIGQRVPLSDGIVDAVFLDDNNEEMIVTVRKAIKAQVIKMSSSISGNFSVLNDCILVNMKVPIKNITDAVHTVANIKCRPTIWSLFRKLSDYCAVLELPDGSTVDSGKIKASRTTNSVYVQYKTVAGEFRSKRLISFNGGGEPKLQFLLGPITGKELCDTFGDWLQYEDGKLTVDVASSPKIAASYKDFMSFISSVVILSQQRAYEVERICYLARWFANRFFEACDGIIPEDNVEHDEVKHDRKERPPMPIEVTSNCIKRSELKALLYGVQSPLAIGQIKGSLQSEAELTETLSNLIPEKDGLDRVFIYEAVQTLLKGKEYARKSLREQDYEVSRQSMVMQELRCMMMEYDYVPPELKDGALIFGTKVRIRTGGV